MGEWVRLGRNVSMYRPFWVSFAGTAERQRVAAMTPEEYARHVGLPEDQVARVRRLAELRDRRPGGPAAGRGRAAAA
jgi:hypothetical protein